LKTGYGAIEERARSELGMLKQDEIFFQVLEDAKPLSAPPAVPGIPVKSTEKPAEKTSAKPR